MDVWYFGAWIAWFQLLWTLLLLPLTSIPSFGGHHLKDMPELYAFGFRCWLGVSSQPGDECSYNYIITTLYIAVNFIYNIMILLLTKHASATVFTLSFAVQLPLSQIANDIPQIHLCKHLFCSRIWFVSFRLLVTDLRMYFVLSCGKQGIINLKLYE